MEIIQRLPLTLSALISFGAFSLASVSIRALKNYYYARKRSRAVESISDIFPADMWGEILSYLMTRATDAELLQLSLINKACNAKVTAFFATNHRHPDGPAPRYNSNLTPKRFYFFDRHRFAYPPTRNFALPEDFELNTKYGPWLDHNILRHPENFWLFMKAVVFNPEWILPLLIKVKYFNGASDWIDKGHQTRMLKYVNFCSVLLSYLPFLDSIIYQFRTTVPETALASVPNFLLEIWSNNNSWKITTQLRWLSQLAVFQLFDNAFYNYQAGFYRLALLIPVLPIMNGGIKRLLIFAGISAVLSLIWFMKKNWKPRETVAIMTIASLAAIFLYPVPALSAAVVAAIMASDGILRMQPYVDKLMTWTKVILLSAIVYTIAIIFWR